MYIFCVMQPLTHWRRTNWGTILWNFQLHFFVWKCQYYNINFTEMCHKVPINEKHLLAQIMARFRTGDEPWHQGDAESSLTIKCQKQVLNGSRYWHLFNQYTDVIMSTMVSQITSLTTVYSTVYSGTDYKKTPKLHVTGLCAGNSPVTGEFPAQRASNAKNVSIWWRHHATLYRQSTLKMHWWFLILWIVSTGIES